MARVVTCDEALTPKPIPQNTHAHSTFAQYTVVADISCAKISEKAPLEKVGVALG